MLRAIGLLPFVLSARTAHEADEAAVRLAIQGSIHLNKSRVQCGFHSESPPRSADARFPLIAADRLFRERIAI